LECALQKSTENLHFSIKMRLPVFQFIMARSPSATLRKQSAKNAAAPPARRPIPAFSLYGEDAVPSQELLHIEEVQSRSKLYRWEIEPHVHQGLYQVLWLYQGEAEVRLDERRETVHGPGAIVIPPSVVHGFRFAPDTDGLVLTLSANFLVEGDLQAAGESFRTLFSSPGVVQFAPHDELAERLNALLRQLVCEFSIPGMPDSPVVGWLARAVVWRLAHAQAQRQPQSGGRGHWHQALFTRFMLLVEAHFLEHWSLGQYASHLGLSIPRLNRLTQAESRKTALEIVHERLTREACRRLLYIAAPAANLAAELGFDDPAYFSRFFKKRTGLTPRHWRLAQTPVAS
jgi:AraC family transcriptional activator of pobA